jgi:hypothetical protein
MISGATPVTLSLQKFMPSLPARLVIAFFPQPEPGSNLQLAGTARLPLPTL